MESLVREIVRALAAGEEPSEQVARLGMPEPRQATAALARAVRQPDLGAAAEPWLASLLLTARPGFGADALVEIARQHRAQTGAPLDLSRTPALPLVLGSSNVLTQRLLQHPEWTEDLAGAPPEAPAARELAADWEAIRTAKYRGLLRVAARDLLLRPFAEGLRELSDLADACLDAALRCAAAETGVAAPGLLALGKLGGRELNFSSDVDLLFLYEAEGGEADLRRNQEVARLVRQLKTRLEEPTEGGFGYRVDLDLRPEGATGVLANSVEAALTYYESFGAEWERQALLRLRFVAGDARAAEAFLSESTPFVYRRAIGLDVLRAVGDMKVRIESERRRAGRNLTAELKEGPGGIRDVEFQVQALQLLYAGREPALRTGNVLEALGALGRHRVLPEDNAESLARAYEWLRRAEHALQLEGERQTHRMPDDAAGRLALARRMGYADAEGSRARARMLDEWTAVRAEVRAHFEALILGSRFESNS